MTNSFNNDKPYRIMINSFNKARTFLPALAMVAFATTFPTSMAALDYSAHSPLSSGKWAKLGVVENGVYEISYDKLRELGFTNPESVGVWGEGAPMYPYNFTYNGKRQIPDTFTPVSVWHHDNKLYFYATGPENISLKTDSSVVHSVRFNNNGRNIYTNYGIYFLTDSDTHTEVVTEQKELDDDSYIDIGFSYYYHELDKTQGLSCSGKDFWGESFTGPQSRTQTFPYSLPGWYNGTTSTFTIRMVGQVEDLDAEVAFDGTKTFDVSLPQGSLETYYVENKQSSYDFLPKQQSGNFTISMPASGISVGQAHLDYYLITYMRSLKFVDGESQFSVTSRLSSTPTIKFPDGENVVGWDVTNASAPINIIPSEEENLATITRGDRNLVFFDTTKTQKTPSFIAEVANQDLHARVAEDSEMVIITTDEYMDYATQLADFHREYDGMNVLVASINDIYNEFSQGRPDPMAYRNFCKMLYEGNGNHLKHILLYGPCLSNVRYSENEDKSSAIIMLQGEANLRSTDVYAATDLYGSLQDKVMSALPQTQMQVSVGILPVGNTDEAQRINEKIKRYYFDEYRPYWIDRVIYSADDADSETHLLQSDHLATTLKEYGDASDYTPFPAANSVKVYMGEYGKQNFSKKFVEEFQKGALVCNYIGHGCLTSMGKNEIFHSSEYNKFKNNRLGFMNFAGCMSTIFECGMRGIPEQLVLTSDYGLIGGQLSVRSSWSTENYAYMTSWQKRLTSTVDAATQGSPTMGEVTRLAKNDNTNNTGKYKFVLMADPALRIPVPTVDIDIEGMSENMNVGAAANVKGTLYFRDKKTADNFNGTLVVKWYAAPVTTTAKNSLSKYKNDPATEITYEEEVVATQAYEVKDGKFDISLQCPVAMASQMGSNVKVTFIAYDAENTLAASGCERVNISLGSSTAAEDVEAPMIPELSVNLQPNGAALSNCVLHAVATDNSGLRIDGHASDMPLKVTVDNKIIEDAFNYVSLEEGSRRLVLALPLEGLAKGSHDASIMVTDYAGNRSMHNITFDVENTNLLAAMRLAEGACRTQATLTMQSAMEGDSEMVITDAYGNEVVRKPLDSDIYVWNLKDNSGTRVPAGLYRAYVVTTPSSGFGSATKAVYIPVLKPL